MIVYTFVIFASGFAGGVSAALLLACCRCAADSELRAPHFALDQVAARDARVFSNLQSTIINHQSSIDLLL